MTPTHDTTTLAGSRCPLAVHRWANSAPTQVVVLAHGYAEHAGRYHHVAERLVDAGAAVIAPDHLGHGRSGGDRGVTDVGAMVDDLAAVHAYAAAVHPGRPVALIGHSLGGLLATTYVQRGADIDALVLSGPFIGGNPAIAALLTLDPIPEVPLDPAALSRDPAVAAAYAQDPLIYDGPFLRETLEDVFAAVDAVRDGPALGALPTLWIHGELDPLAPVEPVRETLRGLRLEGLRERVYSGAMHEVFNETNRDEVLDEVVAFLEEHSHGAG